MFQSRPELSKLEEPVWKAGRMMTGKMAESASAFSREVERLKRLSKKAMIEPLPFFQKFVQHMDEKKQALLADMNVLKGDSKMFTKEVTNDVEAANASVDEFNVRNEKTMLDLLEKVDDALHEVNMTWEGQKAKFRMEMTPVKQYFAASKDDALRKYNIVLARAMAGIKYVDNKLERVVRKHEQSMGLFDQLQESFDKNSKAADERAEAMPGLIEETLSKLHKVTPNILWQ